MKVLPQIHRQAGRADRSKFNDEPWGDHGAAMGMELSPPNNDMAMDQYLLIPFLRGMNIHLPAILGFTRYQGFDTLPYLRFHPINGQRNGEIQISFKYIFLPPEKIIFWQKKATAKKRRFFPRKSGFISKKTHTLKFPKKQLKFHQETGFLIFTSGTQGLLHSRDFATLVSYPRNEVGQWEEAAQEFGR